MKFIHFLWLLFDLPNGSIWSNLCASAVVSSGLIILHSKLIKNIQKRFDEKEQRIDTKLAEHHESIKRYIDERTQIPES